MFCFTSRYLSLYDVVCFALSASRCLLALHVALLRYLLRVILVNLTTPEGHVT